MATLILLLSWNLVTLIPPNVESIQRRNLPKGVSLLPHLKAYLYVILITKDPRRIMDDMATIVTTGILSTGIMNLQKRR